MYFLGGNIVIHLRIVLQIDIIILALLHSYDVKIKLSQAFIPYDRLIHKKFFFDVISPLAGNLK